MSTNLTGRQGKSKCEDCEKMRSIEEFFSFCLCFWFGLFDCVSIYSLMAKLK